MTGESFSELASRAAPPLDELALALAAEFRDVERGSALAELDRFGAEVTAEIERLGRDEAEALSGVLGGRHRFIGDRDEYDHPDNSMLDLVIERRKGLPIVLSVLYIEVGRRAGVPIAGVGLPGHYVVADLEREPPLLLDPFSGGGALEIEAPLELRPWGAHETALRMLNNLTGSYLRRGDLARAIRAAKLRLDLPLDDSDAEALGAELRSLQARLN